MRSMSMGAVAILTLCTVVGLGRPALADQDDSTQNQGQPSQSQQSQDSSQTQTQQPAQNTPVQNQATTTTSQNGRWVREFARFSKTLNLTEDQQAKIQPLFQNQFQQIDALRGDKTLSRRDRMAKVQAIRAGTRDQIKAYLTPEQIEKWGTLKSEARERDENRGQQNQGVNQNWRSHRRGNATVTWQERYAQFSKTLGLTEDQQEKIQPIFQDEDQQITAVFDDTSVAKEDKAEKVRSIRQATQEKIETLLTPDQMEKWGQWKQQERDRAEDQSAWQKHSRDRKTASWQQQFNRLNKTVGLTDDQKEKIKPIFQGAARQIAALNRDKTMSATDRESAIADVKKATWTQIQSLLTSEQVEKMAAVREDAQNQNRTEDQKQPTGTTSSDSNQSDSGNSNNGQGDTGNSGGK